MRENKAAPFHLLCPLDSNRGPRGAGRNPRWLCALMLGIWVEGETKLWRSFEGSGWLP